MNTLMKLTALLFLLFAAPTLHGQNYVESLKDIEPDADYENISVKKVYTDSALTCFVIWVKVAVKAHYHVHHTENIVVLEGTAEMIVDGKTYTIEAGDYITIPQGKVHAVSVTSKKPLKVVSIQAPEFLGKDRIFIE